MAIPTTVAERLGRRQTTAPVWFGQLLIFSSVLLAASLLLYAGLRFGYLSYLNSQVTKADEKAQELERSLSAEEKARLTDFYSRIANIKQLLSNRSFVTPLLGEIERYASSKVQLTKIAYQRDNGLVQVSGIASSMEDFSAQVSEWRKINNVENVSFTGVSVVPNTNLVQFDGTIAMKKK